ncbi:TRICHOME BIREFRINGENCE-LIKE 7 [Tasmannia lanceolata]|uniref:TRICHOME BIREFRINGENCE-LIKE 7 n=1 Tax=Tasmannia lanceolata TaxID=3420 RepID=UPI00406294B2
MDNVGFYPTFLIEMVSSFNRSSSAYFTRRSVSFNSPSPRVLAHRNNWVSLSFKVAIVIWVFITIFLAVGWGYMSVFPNFGKAFSHRYGIPEFIGSNGSCDFSNGRWVKDDTYPLYNSSECPFAERGFNCLANGRTNNDYLKWRWKPQHCDIPRFDVHNILERLRGKRVVFVGDSMSRTQWESLICWLMTGVEDKSTVYEINGNKITKQIRFLGTQFSSYNFTIEFFRSVFIVQQGRPPRHGPKRVLSTLKLDVLDDINKKWIDSDILIFNSGQWWNKGKLFDTGCYFQVNGSLKLGMPITNAFRIALETWASWVETTVNTSRTHVFFRTFEPSHWSNPGVCTVTQQPLSETKGHEHNEFSDIISEVVSKMKVPVTVLHVTLMSAFRSDAHVGTSSDSPFVPDCSHWCLPGVPDAWNELVFSYLLGNRGNFF